MTTVPTSWDNDSWTPSARQVAQAITTAVPSSVVGNVAFFSTAGGRPWGQSATEESKGFTVDQVTRLLGAFNPNNHACSLTDQLRFQRINVDTGDTSEVAILKKQSSGLLVIKNHTYGAVVHMEDDGGSLGSVRVHFERLFEYYCGDKTSQ